MKRWLLMKSNHKIWYFWVTILITLLLSNATEWKLAWIRWVCLLYKQCLVVWVTNIACLLDLIKISLQQYKRCADWCNSFFCDLPLKSTQVKRPSSYNGFNTKEVKSSKILDGKTMAITSITCLAMDWEVDVINKSLA